MRTERRLPPTVRRGRDGQRRTGGWSTMKRRKGAARRLVSRSWVRRASSSGSPASVPPRAAPGTSQTAADATQTVERGPRRLLCAPGARADAYHAHPRGGERRSEAAAGCVVRLPTA